ncbi:MAG: efflux RND transporter periplasmic adaptor subunit [Syntrophales bacterium]|nr:efflux RND transporter periplasmic adaptor subunit [Syntrophales bacterium]
MKKKIFFLALVCVLVGFVFILFFSPRASIKEEKQYAGVLEAAREARLAFQTTGRVSKIFVSEGDRVEEGQIIASLDPQELETRRLQAEKALQKAEESLRQAQALLATYEATLPAELARAEANAENARKLLLDSEKNYNRFENLFARKVIAEKDRDAAKLQYETAQENLKAAEALVVQARGNLGKIEATRYEVMALRAQVAQAKAVLEQAVIQKGYAELRAPFKGIVTSRNCEPGEVVTPTREVITISDLSSMDLKIFVEETEIGRVRPGQRAEVKIDTFPHRIFSGSVSYISPVGEFTPKFIQTRKERVKLVYMVKVNIPNPDLALKTGLPADCRLIP